MSTALAAARYGLSVADVQAVVSTAIGGDNVGEVIQGRERYPINVRYPREIRDSLERLRQLPFVTDEGRDAAAAGRGPHRHRGGPADAAQRERPAVRLGLRRRARPGPAFGRHTTCRRRSPGEVAMPAGYAVSWSGQFEYLERATERLKLVVPVTLAVIFVLLYLLFRSFARRGAGHGGGAVLARRRLLARLGCSGHSISVATAVGFIALAGVAAEFGVVMLVYLKNALAAAPRRRRAGQRGRRCSRPSAKARCCAFGPRR